MERVVGIAVVLVTRRWRVWGVKRDTSDPNSRRSSSSSKLPRLCVCVVFGHSKSIHGECNVCPFTN